MRKLLYILEKEFLQIIRDKTLIAVIFGVPILQILILPWAVDLDVRHVSVAILDFDRSSYSRELISKFGSTDVFSLYSSPVNYKEALRELQQDKVDIVLTIPANFERNLVRDNQNQLSAAVNSINGVKAVLGAYYLNMIVRDFNNKIIVDLLPESQQLAGSSPIDVRPLTWVNAHGNYKHFMVPAILVLLLTVVGMALSAVNIVKEKEIGTIEQINVTPIKKWEFIIGKLLPFWIIGLIVFTIGLTIMRFVYGIPILGSTLTLYLFANLYIFSILGMGLFISNFAQTQQQAMFINFFFIMIFILMSGLFTSLDSMPSWARVISNCIPITYFMQASRAIILKGSSFSDIWILSIYILIFGIVLNISAIVMYRKRN